MLQDEIEQSIKNIDKRMLQNIFENKKKRANMCLEQNGEHFKNLVWSLATINLFIFIVNFMF